MYLACCESRTVSALSRQVIRSPESPSRTLVSSELTDLQVELHDTLRALQRDPTNVLDDDEVSGQVAFKLCRIFILFTENFKENVTWNNDDS